MPTHSQPHLPRAAAAQRGATLIFTAFVLLMLVATLGLAVEVGRLYAAQQRLQTAANIAALDAARFVGGCRALPDGKTLQEIAQDAVDRNYPNRAAGSVQVVEPFGTGRLVTNADNLRSISTDLNGARASAVFLTVQDPSFTPLLGALFDGSGPLTASAAAANRPEATISIGSTLVDSDLDLLGDLLGVNAALLAQGDLATTSISLADLLNIEANAVTTNGLIEELSVNDALENLGDALTGAAPPIVATVQQLLLDQGGTLFLDEILTVAGEVGSDLSVNAGALVNAAAQLAATQRDAAVTLPLNLTVPGIANVTANLRVLEPPQLAAGPPGQRADGSFYTVAHTAQVGVELAVELIDIEIGGLGLLGLGLLEVSLLDLPLALEAATADAKLTEINCASSDQPFHEVTVDADSSLLHVGVGRLVDVDGDGDREFQADSIDILGNVTLLGIPLLGGLITVDGTADIPTGGDSDSFPDDPPFEIFDPDDLPTPPHNVGSVLTTEVLLDQALTQLDLDVEVLGIADLPVDALLNPINNLLGGPLAAALAPVLDPVLEGLGLSLGTGAVAVVDLNADQPVLVCTGRGNGCFPE